MGFRSLNLLGVEVLVGVSDTLTQRVRATFGRARIRPGRKVTERRPGEVEPMPTASSPEARRLQERVREVEWWYHSIDLGHGVVTPGGFDHRLYLPHYPIPEKLDGMRALDVATFDGFWAFELERRSASEVVAIDLDRFGMLDLPPPVRDAMTEEELAKPIGRGFELCREILGSKVRRAVLSVYDLGPERLGMFDFVFMSDLLLHLMNPAKALQNVRRVTRGTALIVETFDPHLPGTLMEFKGGTSDCVWWRMSYGGLERIVQNAGFRSVELVSKFPIGQAGEKPWLWHAAFRCIA